MRACVWTAVMQLLSVLSQGISVQTATKLLIADEPTTALDVTIQAQILDLMRDIKEKLNTSIMLITHDLGVVAEMADYVVVMYAGKVIEEAPFILNKVTYGPISS